MKALKATDWRYLNRYRHPYYDTRQKFHIAQDEDLEYHSDKKYNKRLNSKIRARYRVIDPEDL